MAPELRIGVFGGTFDPPHLGHASAATAVLGTLELDRVLWVPAHASPHKRDRPTSPPGVRWEMVRAAVHDQPGFEASSVELDRGGVSYTVDTLRHFAASRPRRDLFLILGPDLACGFASWRAPEEIARLATPVALRFGGWAGPVGFGAGGCWASNIPAPLVVDLAPCDISSSRVRGRVARGGAVSHMVEPGVLAIIQSRKLYVPTGAATSDPVST